MSAAFLSVKKIVSEKKLRDAVRHNLREIQAEIGAGERIDGSRSELNAILSGEASSFAVIARSKKLLEDANIKKVRKDAVRGVEVVISLPKNIKIDSLGFFESALSWISRHFQVPVLSATLHRDEAEEHIHVLLLPLINGRLTGSDLVGNKTKLTKMQQSFYQDVAQSYGLTKPVRSKSLSRQQRDTMANEAIHYIQHNPRCLLADNVRKQLKNLISSNPEPLSEALRLPPPTFKQKNVRPFLNIMTKPTKPESQHKPNRSAPPQ